MIRMANYIAVTTCKAPFKVKDPDAFEKELQRLGMATEKTNPMAQLWYSRNEDAFQIYGYSAMSIFDQDKDDSVQIEDVIQPHLVKGEVCVLREVGYTKCCYDSGEAFTVIVTPHRIKVLNLNRLAEDEEKKLVKGD